MGNTARSAFQLPAAVVVVDHLAGHAAVDADVLAGDEARLVGAEEESASYRIDITAIEQIRQKCSEYGVLGWGELELSELQLLDAPITSVSFAYGDNEYYSVRSDYDLPEQGYGFFSAFYEILEQYKTQGGN